MLDGNKRRYKKTWFNPLYYHLREYLRDNTVRRILIFGSSSAAKSYTIQQALCIDGDLRNYSSLLFRKEGTSLKDTLKQDLIDIVDLLRLEGAYETMDFELRHRETGRVVRLRGLDKAGKLKGIKGFRKLYFDELDQFTFEDWKEAGRRLRGEPNQQIIASLNPVNQENWTKKKFIDNYKWIDQPTFLNIRNGNGEDLTDLTRLHETSYIRRSTDGRNILIKTTYHDNKFVVGGTFDGEPYGYVDEQALAEFEEMKITLPDDYKVYGLGEWGEIRNDSPFFRNYDPKFHYSDERLQFHDNERIYLSFDFNYNPTTCGVYQKVAGWGCKQLMEFEIEGGTEKLCDMILNDPIMREIPREFWVVTGDSSGSNRTSSAGNKTDYSIIATKLGLNKTQFINVTKRNKALKDSRVLCDYFLYRVPFQISNNCVQTERDLRIAKPDENGKLYKNREEGFMMDHADHFRYFVHAAFLRGVHDIKLFINSITYD